MEHLFLFGFAAVGFVVVMTVAEHYSKKRREALSAVALQHGFTFDPGGRAVFEAAPSCELFKQGRDATPCNLMQGSTPGFEQVLLFEYSYVTGSGKSRTTHRFTIAGFRLPPPPLPAFQLRAENFLDRLASIVGYDDLDFDSDPEFSKAFHLKTPDTAATAVLFHGAMRDAFRRDPAWSAESSGPWLFLFQRKILPPEQWTDFYLRARALAEQFVTR